MSALHVYLVFMCLSHVYCVRVQTISGTLDGSEYNTKQGKRVFTFQGVPYAKPPVGENRFKEAKPIKGWIGTWSAKHPAPQCYQYLPDFGPPAQIIGSEDCLYLNIYTPTLSVDSNLPVLVYFHGGAFMFGESTAYKPTYFLENHDIVYISVSYRVGPFGFLSTEDNIIPGNNGMKDQVLALKWVQENIALFGGDKNTVTIAGNSAGGASVHLHFISPLSRGLFHRGISSSGSALMPWVIADKPLQKAKMLASSLECPTENTEIMVKCLQQRPSEQIYSVVKDIFQPWQLNPFSPFGPVVENTTRNSFLSEHPYQLLIKGEINDLPWLTSLTTEEGLYPGAHFIRDENELRFLNENWQSISPHLLDYNYTVTSDKKDDVGNQVKSFYLGNKDISVETRNELIQMLGNRHFNADMNLAVRLQASLMSSPVYLFLFSYKGGISLSHGMTKTTDDFGVSHFDDIYYLLSPYDSEQSLQSESDTKMILTMTNIWAGFIISGKPTLQTDIQWDPVSKGSYKSGQINYILIKSHDRITTDQTDDLGNFNFWNSLGLNENANINNEKNIKDEL